MSAGRDPRTVEGFGRQWSRFDQSGLSEDEHRRLFDRYFRIFPWSSLPKDAVGADVGCGSGRWARIAAGRVGRLLCADASLGAARVAAGNLTGTRCAVVVASADALPWRDGSLDFGYSLGVLHHVPDTAAALEACVTRLKPGAPFLLYLYYALETRPAWYRAIWRASDVVRRAVAASPFPVRYAVSSVIAAAVYWPAARIARALERRGRDVEGLPLSSYRHLSFYTIRTDALDRFGTRLERRFTAEEMRGMMTRAGLERIVFSPDTPYWCAVGFRRQPSS